MAEFKVGDEVIPKSLETYEYSSCAANLLKGRIGTIKQIDGVDDCNVTFGDSDYWFKPKELDIATQHNKGKKTMTDTSWEFHSTAKGDINFDDILDCLTHANPIAIMTIKNKIANNMEAIKSALSVIIEKGLTPVPTMTVDNVEQHEAAERRWHKALNKALEKAMKTAPKFHYQNTYVIAIHTSLIHKGDVCQIFGDTDGELLRETNKGIVLEASQSDFSDVIKWAKRVKHAKWPKALRRDATVSVKMPTI